MLTRLSRILPGGLGHRVALLHAPPPSHMFPPLQRFLSARCIGWLCCAILQPIHYFRRGVGYGDRPLHHGVLASLPELRVASVGNHFPGSDLLRHGEPLYAHVCDTEQRRIRPEP